MNGNSRNREAAICSSGMSWELNPLYSARADDSVLMVNAAFPGFRKTSYASALAPVQGFVFFR